MKQLKQIWRLIDALNSVVIFHLHEKLDDRKWNVGIPLMDIFNCAVDGIKATCFGNFRADTVHLVEGRVRSPDIVLGLSCGPMQPAKAHAIREPTWHRLHSFTPSLKWQ